MPKYVVMAAAIGLLTSLVPASAQKFTGSCAKYCAEKICAMSSSKNYCQTQCEQKCRRTNPNAKP
jgi:hypothetical protein